MRGQRVQSEACASRLGSDPPCAGRRQVARAGGGGRWGWGARVPPRPWGAERLTRDTADNDGGGYTGRPTPTIERRPRPIPELPLPTSNVESVGRGVLVGPELPSPERPVHVRRSPPSPPRSRHTSGHTFISGVHTPGSLEVHQTPSTEVDLDPWGPHTFPSPRPTYTPPRSTHIWRRHLRGPHATPNP